MKQKLLFFFLTAFLSLIGGELWATDYVLSGSTRTIYAQSQTTATYETGGKTITVTNDVPKSYDKYSNSITELTYYIKTASATHTIDLSEISSGEKVVSISFKGFNNTNNSETETYTSYISNVNGTDYTEEEGTNQFLSRSLVSAANDEDIKTFTVSGLSITCGTGASITFAVGGRETDLIITITTEENTIDNVFNGTYPYTWQFDVDAAKWTKSISQIKDNTTDWNVVTESDTDKEARNVSTSITNSAIDICKGLSFAATAGNVCLDWTYRQLWMNGTLTIPSLKVGQTITFDSNDNVIGDSKVGSTAGKVFTVTTAGDVSFTVNTYIRSIAVTKNDLTTFAFNNTETYYGDSGDSPSGNNQCTGEFVGRTTTFNYKVGRSQVLRTRVNVAPAFDVTGITVDNTNFGVSSNTSTVLDASSYSVSKPNDGKIWYWGVQVKKPGTASLTYSFNGTDAYNAKNYTEQFTIQKDDIDLTFDEDFVVKTVDNPAFTNSFKLNGLTLPVTDDYAGTINTSSFTYEVKTVNDKETSNIVSVSNTGEVTLSSPGAVLIHAKLASTDWYNGVDRKYTLVVNPSGGTDPALQWIDDVSSVSVQYNDAVSHTATGTIGVGQTIKYRSADTSVASVDATGKVTGTGRGSTTIYAYVEPTSTHNYAEISYNVSVTSAGELKSFKFIPNNGKVNNGKSITPKLAFPTIPGDGVTSLKVTKIQVLERNGSSVSESALTEDNAIAACDIIGVDNASNLMDNWILNADGKVNKVNVTINGKTVGKAEITVTFTSSYYNEATATYTVEVTAAGTRNFSWADGDNPEYYVYAGDFMMLPAISGNSNGNNNYSNGEKNSKSYSEGGSTHSALQAYVYERKNGTIKWNEKDLKVGEGFPDFEVINGTGSALMFFSKGQGSSHADSLMVFCETEGNVTLRAYDPQDHEMYCDATIHILPVANLASAETSAGVTFPYTWDFTTNFDMASLAGNNEHYWIPMKSGGEPTGAYTNGLGFFDIDWADVNSNGSTDERNYKYFVAGASNSNVGYMPQFNGMKIKLQGTSSYANKIDRLRILNYEEGKGRLQFSGGDHILYLPLPDTKPSTYRVYVRAEGIGTSYVYINEDASTKQTIPSGTPTILYFESSAISGDLRLSFNNARVYWIACSTEAKNVVRPLDQNSNLSYAAASYSYPEDLDLSKSAEVNEDVTAYYASSYGYNADAAATGTAGYAVVMTPITTKVPANTGLILKKNTNDASTSCYMIANGKNVASYTDPAALGTNYLKATPAGGGTVSSNETIDSKKYTNFTMAYAYKMYRDPMDAGSAYTGYLFDRDWSFYRIMGDVHFSPQKSYLQIPGNLYVDRDGKIVEGAASRRAADDNRPSTKPMLDIIFEDEPLGDPNVTGISTVSDRLIDNDAWYTLQGIRVDAPAKGGIYIHNGRKVVIK